jgi:hypothetical protein
MKTKTTPLIEHVVAVLTPTVFAPAAAFISRVVSVDVPNSHFSTANIVAVEITGFTAACVAGWGWLYAHRKDRVESGAVELGGTALTEARLVAYEPAVEAIVGELGELGPNLARIIRDEVAKLAPKVGAHLGTALEPMAEGVAGSAVVKYAVTEVVDEWKVPNDPAPPTPPPVPQAPATANAVPVPPLPLPLPLDQRPGAQPAGQLSGAQPVTGPQS